jgi:hypothetical protein
MTINRWYTQSSARYHSLNRHLSDLRDRRRRIRNAIGIGAAALFAVGFLAWNVYDAYQLTLENCMEANNKMNLAAAEALVAMQTRSHELNHLLSGPRVDINAALAAVQDLRVATGVLRGHLFGLTETE